MTVTVNPTEEEVPVRRGRGWLVVGLVLAVAIIVVTAGHVLHRDGGQEISIRLPLLERVFDAPITRVTMHLDSGSVTINGSAATQSLVETVGTEGGAIPSNYERVDHGSLDIESRCAGGGGTGNCVRNYTLMVPSMVGVTVVTGTGAVTVLGVQGQVTVQSGNGLLAVQGGSGRVHARSGTGSIQVTGDHTATDVASTRGNIAVQGGSGSLRATTGTGGVSATGMKATAIAVSSQNGDVTLQCATPPKKATVASGTGSVTVVLPAASTYAVFPHTSTGRIDLSVPVDPTSTHVIHASTTNGNIQIKIGTG